MLDLSIAERRLRDRFLELGGLLQWDGEAAQSAFADLLAAYEEPNRHYHDLRHLYLVVTAVEELAPAGRIPDLLAATLAAYYHDAVYDPQRKDNEERSAQWAERDLRRLGVMPAMAQRVADLVRLTATHRVDGDDAAARALLDADLAILAAENDIYDRYADGIRREYAHVPEADFVAGRRAVLQGFLDRDRIFLTSTGYGLWEDAARANLRRELARLG